MKSLMIVVSSVGLQTAAMAADIDVTIKPGTGAKVSVGAISAAVNSSTQTQEYDGVPGIARDLIDEAALTGDPASVTIVAETTAKVLPTFAASIETYAQTVIGEMGVGKITGPAKTASTDGPNADAGQDGIETRAKTVGASEIGAGDTDASEAAATGFFALEPWEGQFTTGASFASGNSDNVAIGLTLDATRTAGKFIHAVKGYFNLGEANDTLNQKRWGGSYQLDYGFSDRATVFGRLEYEEDEFSGFDYRLFAGTGLGYFIANSDPFTFKTKAGPGFRYSLIDENSDIDEELALYAGYELNWKIRDGVTFDQSFDTTWTDPTTTFLLLSTLTINLWDDLTTGMSASYRYETNPPAGRENADTVLQLNFGYGF